MTKPQFHFMRQEATDQLPPTQDEWDRTFVQDEPWWQRLERLVVYGQGPEE